MEITTYRPDDVLTPFVERYMIIRSEHGTDNHILPDTSVVMAFRLSGRISYREKEETNDLPQSVVTGLRNSSRRIRYATKSAALLVVFREGGAAVFLREPVHELFGLHIPADCLTPRSILAETEEKLAGAVHDRQRIAVVEQFLLSRLHEPGPDRLIRHSIQKIRSAGGIIKIRDLLADIPLSRDPFEKRFRKIVGTSPKQFAGIVRLRHVIKNYSQKKSLTETAYSAGYFDQAHFIKDFKSFTGQTPKAFFDSPSFW